MADLLEDPDGSPYPEEVQTLLAITTFASAELEEEYRNLLVTALESVAWHAWEDGNSEGQRFDRDDSTNPHAVPEGF